MIVADDLGYGDLGVYGQTEIQTPILDQLAADGMRFTNFYAGSTVCAPSRSVLMTGMHTGRNQIRGNREVRPMGQQPLRDETFTMAEAMKVAGYRTGLIGKWGLGAPGSEGEPNRQGFDYFFGYLGQRHAHNFYPEFLFRNTERVPLPGNVLPEPKREDGAGQAIQKTTYSHDLLAEEAISFVQEDSEQPYFLLLTVTIPHANNEAGDEGMEVPDLGAYADKEWPAPQKGLAAMISRMDTDIGRLLTAVEATGETDNTLVLFTSDNGPHAEGGNDPDYFDSNGDLRGKKRDLYEGGIRVPLLAKWPGVISAGSTSDHMGYFGDFYTTFAEAANLEFSGQVDPDTLNSISMMPVLTGKQTQATHPYLYWEFYEQGSRQAVRKGPWKAVRQPMFDGTLELYNLDDDLGETTDLAATNPEIATEMAALMEAAHVENPQWQIR
ncbi:MAG: arylsulfatase [Bacteroidota bacterium]